MAVAIAVCCEETTATQAHQRQVARTEQPGAPSQQWQSGPWAAGCGNEVDKQREAASLPEGRLHRRKGDGAPLLAAPREPLERRQRLQLLPLRALPQHSHPVSPLQHVPRPVGLPDAARCAALVAESPASAGSLRQGVPASVWFNAMTSASGIACRAHLEILQQALQHEVYSMLYEVFLGVLVPSSSSQRHSPCNIYMQ